MCLLVPKGLENIICYLSRFWKTQYFESIHQIQYLFCTCPPWYCCDFLHTNRTGASAAKAVNAKLITMKSIWIWNKSILGSFISMRFHNFSYNQISKIMRLDASQPYLFSFEMNGKRKRVIRQLWLSAFCLKGFVK